MSVTSTTMTIDAHFNAGPHSGTEKFEAWLRNTIFGTWEKKLDQAIAGAPDPSFGPIIDLPPGVPHDVACRLTRSGAAQAGSTSADPLDWPPAHRQAAVQLLLDQPVDDGSFVGDALGAPGVSQLYMFFARTPSDSHDLVAHSLPYDDPDWPDIRYEVEWSAAGMGTWAALDGFFDNETSTNHNLGFGRWHDVYNADLFDIDSDTVGLLVIVEPHAGTTIDVRMRRIARTLDGLTVLQTGDWMELLGLVIPA